MPSPAEAAGSSSSGGRRRLRRRGRRRRPGLWAYLRHGPPAELLDTVRELLRPQEDFRHRRGPWRRGLVVARERRQRKPSSPLGRWLRHGPGGELVEACASVARRHPLALSLTVAAVTWWFWPWLRPPVSPMAVARGAAPDVVAVAAEDYRRTITAVTIWKDRPKSLLVLMIPSPQSLTVLNSAALNQSQRQRVITLASCGDTVTEMADLSRWLGTLRNGPGQLMLVTSPAHIARMTAIGQVMVGGQGWRVEGVASQSSNYNPENIFRRWRDELRGQLWRATGFTGKKLFVCTGRNQGFL